MYTPEAFSVQLTGEVVIASSWPRSVVTCETDVQTDEQQHSETAVQTSASALQKGAAQHDKAEGTEQRKLPQATLQGGQYVYDTRSAATPYKPERAAAFVERCRAVALSLLRRSARRARALDGVATDAYADDDDDDEDEDEGGDEYAGNDGDGVRVTSGRRGGNGALRCLHTLVAPSLVRGDGGDNNNNGVDGGLAALAVSCNATGTLLAAAYGRLDVSGWCDGKGAVCVWNVLRLERGAAAGGGGVAATATTRSTSSAHAPQYTLELDSYATCVAFHPTRAQTLAVGTYDGEVVVYVDLSDGRGARDAAVAATGGDTTTSATATTTTASELSTRQAVWCHREAVTSLQWVQSNAVVTTTMTTMATSSGSDGGDAALRHYLLATAAQDGVVALWTVSNKLATPLALYQVQSRHHTPVGITALTYTRTTTTATTAAATATMTAATSVPAVDGALVVGLESGDVGSGRTNISAAAALAAAHTSSNNNNDDDGDGDNTAAAAAGRRAAKASRHRSGGAAAAEEPTPLPLDVSWHDAHAASVLSLCASPFLRHVAVSASGDGSARVYSALDRAALLTLALPESSTSLSCGAVCAAAFSTRRPCVLALATQDGALHVYDLQQSHTTPVCSAAVRSSSNGGGVALVCVAFDRAGALVTGDVRGAVRVWRLPQALTHMTPHERAVLQSVRASRSGNDTAAAGTAAAAAAASEEVLQAMFGVTTR